MKNTIKYISYLLIGFSLISFAACNDWLDLEPENKLVKQEFWQSKEDVAAVMAAMYNSYGRMCTDVWAWGEVRADMITFNSSFGDFQRIGMADILPTNGAIKWSGFYNTINLANTIMLFAPDVLKLDETFDIKTEKAYEAEALFFRAKCYFDMVRVWKEVPLVLEASSSDTVSFSIPKNPESEIIKQIESDLLLAKTTANKDEYADIPEMFKGRANVYSINALLADVYLWSEQYEKCVEVCNEIINSGKFQLQTQNTWFELYYPGNAPESIFEIQFNDAYDNEENPFNVDVIPPVGSSKVSLKPTALEIFSKTDIRKGDPDPRSKYQYKSLSPKTKRTSSERDANMIYYRYADILLIKAEALAELGNFSESVNYINQIIERAGLPQITLAPDLTQYRFAIMEQRALEFALEGKRWFDVLRFAKKNNFENKYLIINMILAGADVKQRPILRSRVLDTMSYYLPISQSELDHNPVLVQNPYYDR
ncbi:MAG: RagB/SusD family nutrient uptake outer membrane protein [Prolixibacteraceae bacterium]|nr:RagB/SusD family nutrient uptake outer membrane protein [Prolixibacteraceae bacterium]